MKTGKATPNVENWVVWGNYVLLDVSENSIGRLRGTVAERRSETGELSLSYARPAADG